MCFSTSVPKPPPLPPTPQRDEKASLVQDTRLRALRARGVQNNIFTSALGDPGFGKNVNRATLLGQTAAA